MKELCFHFRNYLYKDSDGTHLMQNISVLKTSVAINCLREPYVGKHFLNSGLEF